MSDKVKVLGNSVYEGTMQVLRGQLSGAENKDLVLVAQEVTQRMVEVLLVPEPVLRDELREELFDQLGLLTEIKRMRVESAVIEGIKTGLGIVFQAALGAIL